MKDFISLLILLFSLNIFPQNIHTILIPGTTRPTLQEALDEFWWYAQNKNYLTGTETQISS